MPLPSDEVTELLRAWNAGDENAFERLAPLVQEELRRAAHRYMARERTDHTLQTTALVNELYLRLMKVRGIDWQDRAHFFAFCARMMRRILTDSARSRRYLKRGGDLGRTVPIDEAAGASVEPEEEILAVDEALHVLARIDPRKSQVVELRFFLGLNAEETAETLHISTETVQRDWRLAKLFLLQQLGPRKTDGG